MAGTKFNLHLIKKRRNKIASFLSSYVARPIVGDAISQISDRLLQILPSTVSPSAVFDTVRLLAGTTLSTSGALEFAWRVAGNVPTLIAGDAVVPWSGQREDEIVPVRVDSVSASRRRDDFGFILRCRAQAGTPCPMAFNQFLTARSCSAISRVIGFSNTPWGPFQYSGAAAYFVNTLFFAHLEAQHSREQPWFRNVSASSGMLKANKELLAVRCRNKPCPLNYVHACIDCPVGYNYCSYAVHRNTYVEQLCSVCNKTSLFDPASMESCLTCRKRFSLSTAR